MVRKEDNVRTVLYRNFEEITGGSLLVAMCLVGVTKVVSRYLLTSPMAWTEELATILFAWMVFIGAALALKKHEHFAIEFLVDLLPRGSRKLAQTFSLLVVLVFCALLIGYGMRLVVMNWAVLTPMLEISRGWVYLSVPFGGILMGVRTVEMIVRLWKAGAPPLDHHAVEGVD
jgi:C4-dicarboxylate transporter DctQ subunit